MDRLTFGTRLPEGFAPLIRRRARRTRHARYGAVAALAAVVTTAGTLAATGGNAGGPHTPARAYVLSHVTGALAAPGQANDVIYTVSYTTNYPLSRPATVVRTQGWYGNGAARVQTTSGRTPTSERGFRWSATSLVVRQVNYQDKTWWQNSRSLADPVPAPVASVELLPVRESLAGCHAARPVTGTNFSWQAYIRAMLACGSFRVTGHGWAAGVNAVQLTANTVSVSSHAFGRPSQILLTEILWVNASTYLPAELTWYVTANGPYVIGNGPIRYSRDRRVTTVQTGFQWLPPTRVNLAKLDLVIPHGFKRAG